MLDLAFSIEDHLFQSTYQSDPASYDFIDYDLTTSYFVGYQCILSAFGKGKAECRGRRQVLLGVLINTRVYPFKWDVFPGNKAEVKTLQANIDACKTRFHLGNRNVTLVFDRGIISEENAECIDKAKMKYVSALDRNQIPTCGINLDLLAVYGMIIFVQLPNSAVRSFEKIHSSSASNTGGYSRLVNAYRYGSL